MENKIIVPTFEEFRNLIVNKVPELYEALPEGDKQFPSTGFLFYLDNSGMPQIDHVTRDFENEDEKEKFAAIMKTAIKLLESDGNKPLYYLFISEVWLAKIDAKSKRPEDKIGNRKFKQPSEREDKIECLMVYGEEKTKQYLEMYSLENKPNVELLAGEHYGDVTGMSGRFTGFVYESSDEQKIKEFYDRI